MTSFDTPGRSTARLADITGEIARHAGRLDNAGKPHDYLPRPKRIGWLAWHWRHEVNGAVVADGIAWRREVAYRRQYRAYLHALASRSGLCDRDAVAELRTDGPVT